MRFQLIDAVLEVSGPGLDAQDQGPTRAVAIKHITAAEEYLADHFPGFPILPGVFMLEALVQTARHIARARSDRALWVLGAARAVKYGCVVPPGSSLRLEVELISDAGEALEFKGVGLRLDPAMPSDPDAAEPADSEGRSDRASPPTAVSGRFTLRPARL